jgi:hypothetical protein
MSFTNAPRRRIAPVSAALAVAQGRVSALIALAQGLLMADLGAAPTQIGPALEVQARAAALLPQLYALGSVLSRMASNIAAAGTGGSTQTLVGSDLSFVAAQVYGDATAWTTIARANQLTDPVLSGINTLTIPPTPDGAGGVLRP